MIVEKALMTKIPKLVKTAADKRVLLLEREQIAIGDGQIYDEVVKLAPKFPDLAKIHEIWLANTCILASEGFAYFTHLDGGELVERLTFENGILKMRRDDRATRKRCTSLPSPSSRSRGVILLAAHTKLFRLPLIRSMPGLRVHTFRREQPKRAPPWRQQA
jgi:hypothetical protein